MDGSIDDGNTASTLTKISLKLKLLNLIIKAHKEYNSYDFTSAQKNLEKAYIIDKKNAVILRGLGCVHQYNNEFDIAISFYKLALIYSINPEIEYTLIAVAYYEQGKLDKAINYFNLAIDKNDDYSKAYEGRNQAMLENHIKIIELQEILSRYKF